MTDTEKQAERDKLFGMFTDEKTTIEDLFKYMEEFVNTHSNDDLYQGSPFYSTKYTPLDRMIGCLMYDEGRYLGKYKRLRWSDTSNGPYPQNASKAPDDAINWYKNAPNTGIQKQEWPLKKATQIILGKLTDSGDLEFWKEVLGLSPVPTATPAPATPSKPPESAEGIISDGIKNSRKKCIVFTGAPGTGKTYCVEEYVKRDTKQDGKDGAPHPNWKFVQFHSSYDYTDFVEGLRPVKKDGKDGEMEFVRMDGIFKAFCRRAARKEKEEKEKKEEEKEKKEKFYFIIDEINRADLGRVFGELMYCFEKRGEEHRITTPYANLPTCDKHGEPLGNQLKDEDGNPLQDKDGTPLRDNDGCFEGGFYIPDNVIIIGTMNDIDRSVESMDFALRRRFVWHEVEVTEALLTEAFQSEGFSPLIQENAGLLAKRVLKMNEVIRKHDGLDRHYDIAQGQFHIPAGQETGLDGLLDFVWRYRIRFLLEEYVRGEREKDVRDFLDQCWSALSGGGRPQP